MKKIDVAVLGATGMVGQRFVKLLENHPWFDVKIVAASAQSKGIRYIDSVRTRWKIEGDIPDYVANLVIKDVDADAEEISKKVKMVFSAIDLDKEKIKEIENKYASMGVAIISNNSAHRWTNDVAMIIPEINPEHLKLIDIQRQNHNWKTGLIVTKPNCSIQSYVPVIKALEQFGVMKVSVTTLQAISGAGHTFETWPEMIDNVIPLINGEEEKSEKEPLKILGKIQNNKLKLKKGLKISATCIRVPVTNGHMASFSIKLKDKVSLDKIIKTLENYTNPIARLNLPSAPKQFIKVMKEENRPQTKIDRDLENGMSMSVGRIRKDNLYDFKMVGLSHNTLRGAAGGAVLLAELVYKKGYIK